MSDKSKQCPSTWDIYSQSGTWIKTSWANSVVVILSRAGEHVQYSFNADVLNNAEEVHLDEDSIRFGNWLRYGRGLELKDSIAIILNSTLPLGLSLIPEHIVPDVVKHFLGQLELMRCCRPQPKIDINQVFRQMNEMLVKLRAVAPKMIDQTAGAPTCTCTMQQLMSAGCTCGAMK